MATQSTNLCCLILRQHFGKDVADVARNLFNYTSSTLSQIARSVKLRKSEIATALSVLLKFRLVKFSTPEKGEAVCYSINAQNVLCMLRYPRYLETIKREYGELGLNIVAILLRAGPATATNVMLELATESATSAELDAYKRMFLAMIKGHYLIRTFELSNSSQQESPKTDLNYVPKFKQNAVNYYAPPEIDLNMIVNIKNKVAAATSANDAGVFWYLNHLRFHRDFRDELMCKALQNKLGNLASECFRYILQLIYERTNPWQRKYSALFTQLELRQFIEKRARNSALGLHLDSLIELIETDSLQFLMRTNGGYIVNMDAAFNQLSMAAAESMIGQRYGPSFTRIFRLVRLKKYVGDTDIQTEAMQDKKGCKYYAFKLVCDRYLQLKCLKKGVGGFMAQPTAQFLYYLDEPQVVHNTTELCLQTLTNVLQRLNYEEAENKLLIEKHERREQFLQAVQGHEEHEYIHELSAIMTPLELDNYKKARERFKRLHKTLRAVDENFFLFQMYQHHCTNLTAFDAEA